MVQARRLVYLDHSASTPTDPRVVEAMIPYFSEVYGNASSVHQFGRKAEQAIEDARERMARILNCKPGEIIFTSGGTESNNLALRGAGWQARKEGRGSRVITTPIEHSAVIKTAKLMADVMDFSCDLLPVDETGMVDVEDFAGMCQADTVVASVMYANNEVGTIEPIPQLAATAKTHGVLFHTDAVQAAGQLSLDVQQLGVDMMSLSAHKFYGPKGVGALFVRDGITLVPSQSGGSHEEGRRAGTSNTPFIVGMAEALEIAYQELPTRRVHYQTMRDHLIEGILGRIPNARLTGPREQRLPCHASFVFDGIDGNMLLMHLDLKGIGASSGSACKTGNPEPSGVLLAMGFSPEVAKSSLRLTVGQQTTADDIDYAVDTLAETIEKLIRLRS